MRERHARSYSGSQSWRPLVGAGLLIASGADVKVVQKRMRHASAMTTLNTYGHMWADADESTRAAVAGVLAARAGSRFPRVAD